MTQQERLEYLIERFKEDSVRYRDLAVPESEADKRRMLRSLMNIRMPGDMDEATITVQDAYLRERNAQSGIVEIEALRPVRALGGGGAHADQIFLWQGDITRLAADAIVNAANSEMLGCFVPMHTCIDNCIHTYAGIQLREECDRQMTALREKYGADYEQPTATPMLTDGYNLPAKKIVHIVGPIVTGRLTKDLEQDLADCYRNTLDLCLENDIRSVAFCCISTGVFHFPNKRAAEIAVHTVTDWLNQHPRAMERVIFNVFKEEDKRYYEQELL